MPPKPVVTLLRHEIGGFLSIVLLVRGRKDVPAGTTAIRYGASQKAFLVDMMVLTPFEILLVELIVPWAWLRGTAICAVRRRNHGEVASTPTTSTAPSGR
ncbi:hypothetical protein [Actinokineospora pegani]|uniref:hypothetical protein n=1 Tax=Actinokineospora pegani TaxID=2654637 RepID=UPI0012EA6C4D|nr:hypothetical protein [Actinokineospora pegani]